MCFLPHIFFYVYNPSCPPPNDVGGHTPLSLHIVRSVVSPAAHRMAALAVPAAPAVDMFPTIGEQVETTEEGTMEVRPSHLWVSEFWRWGGGLRFRPSTKLLGGSVGD